MNEPTVNEIVGLAKQFEREETTAGTAISEGKVRLITDTGKEIETGQFIHELSSNEKLVRE
jgi:hypothetical protein